MTNRELNDEFNKDVLPSLNEDNKNEPRTYSQSEVEYMTIHPIAYRRRMKDLQKSRERNIENEIRTQQQDFQKNKKNKCFKLLMLNWRTIEK